MATIINKGRDSKGRSVWEIQVSTSVKVGDTYQRVTETIHGSKKSAQARIREIEGTIAAGVDLNAGKIPFSKYAEQWLEDKQRSISHRTYVSYRREVKRLCGILGSIELTKITVPVVRETLNEARKGIGGEAVEVSLNRTYRVLSMILGRAAKDMIIMFNPCDNVDTPRCKTKERRSLSFAQYAAMQKAIDESARAAYSAYERKETHLQETGHQNKQRGEIRGIRDASNLCAVRIAHATGMRPSEILALQWKHIDFQNGCIHVRQATDGNGSTKETKSAAGIRDIYLNAHTIEALQEWRRFQYAAANKLGIELGANSWVVCTDAFTPVDGCNLNNWWRKWSSANGFEGWRLYELRHTVCTLLLNKGEPLSAVMKQMGHSSITTTQKYLHTDVDAQRELANALNC